MRTPSRIMLWMTATNILLLLLFRSRHVSAEDPKLCLSEQCLRSAARLLSELDRSVDPCQDFYGYVCGKWADLNPPSDFHTHWTTVNEQARLAEQHYIDFLEREINTDEDPLQVYKGKTIYRACKNYDAMENIGMSGLKQATEEAGLSLLPRLERSSPLTQPLMHTLANLRRIFGISALIGFGVVKTVGGSVNMIIPPVEYRINTDLKAADMFVHRRNMIMGHRSKAVQNFIRYFVLAENRTTYNPFFIYDAVQRLTNIESMLETQLNPDLIPSDTHPQSMTISQLQVILDQATLSKKSKIDWKQYVEFMLKNICGNYTENECSSEGIDDFIRNAKFNVGKLGYFIKLSTYLEKVPDNDIELWLWYKVMYNWAPHVNRHTEEMRHIIDSSITNQIKTPREAICARTVAGLYSNLDYYRALGTYNIQEIREQAELMFSFIKAGLTADILESPWMDEESKRRAKLKLDAGSAIIAYFELLFSSKYMDGYDPKDYPHNETTHFANLLGEHRLLSSRDLRYRDSTLARHASHSLFPSPSYINEFNLVAVPEVMLRQPFFDMGLPSMDFGAIGTVIGHELTHGFDPVGRAYDEAGLVNPWMSPNSTAEYDRRAACFIGELSEIRLPLTNITLSGRHGLAETVADVGGIQAAYRGYKQFLMDNALTDDWRLPGLQNITAEQLFFIAYGNNWCLSCDEVCETNSQNMRHPPGFVRVSMGARHSEQFARAFNCPKGSPMNPESKCKIWDE